MTSSKAPAHAARGVWPVRLKMPAPRCHREFSEVGNAAVGFGLPAGQAGQRCYGQRHEDPQRLPSTSSVSSLRRLIGIRGANRCRWVRSPWRLKVSVQRTAEGQQHRVGRRLPRLGDGRHGGFGDRRAPITCLIPFGSPFQESVAVVVRSAETADLSASAVLARA